MDVNKYSVRGIQRYPITTRRYCSMGVIAFKKLDWKECVVRIVDISIIGIGIESSQHLEPGVVLFKERVGGYKSGVLLWSKQDGTRYRGGIKFVSLSRDEEEYLQELHQHPRSQRPFHDPHQIISSLIEFCKKEHGDTH